MPALTGFASPYALQSFGQQPEPKRNPLRAIVEETGEDIIGAGRTLVAPVGSLLELLGATVPVSLDDLSGRDIKGAATVAAMIVGGFAPRALATLLPGLTPFVSGATKTMTALQRVRATALSEAVAGAAFGLTRTALDPAEEDYLHNTISDAVLFGAMGSGFSLIGAGTRATFNIFRAVDRTAKRSADFALASKLQGTQRSIAEFAGQAFRNPDTKELAYVWRGETDGAVNTLYFKFDPALGATGGYRELRKSRPTSADFGTTASAIFSLGYTEPVGVLRPEAALNVTRRYASVNAPEVQGLVERGLLDPTDYTLLQEHIGPEAALRELDVFQWKHFYVRARQREELHGAYNKLLFDTLTRRVSEFGAPVTDIRLSQNDADELFRALAGTEKRKWLNAEGRMDANSPRKLTEMTEEAMRQGLFDFQTMSTSMGVDEILNWLPYHTVPEGFLFHPDINKASAFTKILSGSTVARQHPEVAPFIEESFTRDKTAEIFNHQLGIFVQDLRSKIQKIKLPFERREQSLVRLTIDASAETAYMDLTGSTKTWAVREQNLTYGQAYAKLSEFAQAGTLEEPELKLFTDLHQMWLDRAGEKAIAASKQHGAAVETAVTALVNPIDGFFPRNLTLAREGGHLALGKPGYFPIFNRGAFIVNVTRPGGKIETLSKGGRGFFDSIDEAHKAFQSEMRSGRAVSGAVRNALSDYRAQGTSIAPSHIAQFMQREAEAQQVRIDKFGRAIFGERKLGMRDFEDIGFWDALTLYGRGMNRRLAFGALPQRLLDPADKVFYNPIFASFATMREKLSPASVGSLTRTYIENANKHLAEIPQAKPVLYQWAAQRRDDVLGVPRPSEMAMDSVFSRYGANPRATKRYLGFLRSFENLFRLGGLAAAPVQVTQLLTNTSVEVGLGRTVSTLAKYMARQKGYTPEEIIEVMAKAGVDPQFVASFAGEGSGTLQATIKRIIDTSYPSLRGKFNTQAAWDATHMLFLWPFTTAERLNRMVTFKAAYDKALVEKMGEDAALGYASEIMYKTQFNYHVSDMPEILNSPLGATIFQFKSFFIKEMEFIANLKPRQQAEFAMLLSSLGGVGSVLSIPGPDLVNIGKGLLFDENLDETLKLDGLSEIGVPKDSYISNLILHGLSGANLNIDMSDRISIGGFADMLDFWGGPIISDIDSFGKFAWAAIPEFLKTGTVNGETARAWISRAMPTEARRAMLTYNFMRSDGEYRDYATRKLIYRSDSRFEQLTSYVAPSLDLAQERAAEAVTTKVVTRFQLQLRQAAQGVAEAYLDKDPTKAQQLIEDAHAHGINLLPKHWNYWIKQRQRTGEERRLRRTPQQLRDAEELEALFEV